MFTETITYPGGSGGGGSPLWAASVANLAALALIDDTEGTNRYVVAEDANYIYVLPQIAANSPYVVNSPLGSWVRNASISASQFFVSASAPATASGNMWVNTTTNTVYQYDSVRTKWLGMDENKITASRNALTTDLFLWSSAGLPTNEAGELIPYNSVLVGIVATAATGGGGAWTAEVWSSAVIGVPIASLAVPNPFTAASILTTNIDVNAGAIISLKCAGTLIDRPSITAIFRRRG